MDDNRERLQKVMAQAGVASRRKCEEIITQGRVKVNGIVVTELGTKVSLKDVITVDGKSIDKETLVYYVLNKPTGYLTAVTDKLGRRTVMDLIAQEDKKERRFPVGRLDYDTSGVLLLTNDGELTNILSHPSNHVPKKYIAKLNKAIKIEDIHKLKDGVIVDNVKCTPIRVKVKKTDLEKDYSIVEITIVEGRNHIVKNVFKELGYLVDKLSRIEYAGLTLDGLKSGEYRVLSIKEVKRLYEYKSKN